MRLQPGRPWCFCVNRALRGLLVRDRSEQLADVARNRLRPPVGADVNNGVSAIDTGLAVAEDLPRPGDRRRSQPLGSNRYRDLVVEAEDAAELCLDMATRVVDKPVDEPELAQEGGLGPLGVAECRREVDPPARIGVDPRDPQTLDVSAPVTQAALRHRTCNGMQTHKAWGR